MATFVRLTRKGSKIRARMPKINNMTIVSTYPIIPGWYSTIELETASQYGHLIFIDLIKSCRK